MLTAAVIAAAVLAGVPWLLIGLVAVAVLSPWAFLAGAAVWAIVHRFRHRLPMGPDAEAAFLRGLAAELAAGLSIRAATAAAAERARSLDLSAAVRLASAGMPAEDIGLSIADTLPTNGVAAAAAFRLAAATGGSVGPVFDALARRAEDHGRLARERRSLTAQARLSAWIVGGAPMAFVAIGFLTGLGPDPVALGVPGLVAVSLGVALITVGAGAVWLMLSKAER